MSKISQLLPSNKDYLIVDIFNCYVENAAGDVMVMDRLTSAALESTLDQTEVRGGQGNSIITTLGGNRTVTVSTETPVFMMESILNQLEGDIVIGAGTACKSAMYDVVAGKITLENTPIAGSVKVYTSKGVETPTVTGMSATVTATDTRVKAFYKYASDAKTETLQLNAKNFPKAKKMYLQTLVIDSQENPVAILQIDFPSIKPDGSFNLSLAAERNANNMSTKWTALADASGKIADFKLIPITTTP